MDTYVQFNNLLFHNIFSVLYASATSCIFPFDMSRAHLKSRPFGVETSSVVTSLQDNTQTPHLLSEAVAGRGWQSPASFSVYIYYPAISLEVHHLMTEGSRISVCRLQHPSRCCASFMLNVYAHCGVSYRQDEQRFTV